MEKPDATSEVLERDLRLIVASCLERFPNLRAIILYGGYGRGEGSWYQDSDGAWHAYNDYDVLIVSEKRAPKTELGALEKRLAKKIGIRWVDLGLKTSADLRAWNQSILSYDTKYASKVLYGDASVLDEIPEVKADRLPWVEARVLYQVRLYTLLGSLGPNGMAVTLHDEEARFFRNQMAKAILAAVDVLLLAHGRYHASYRERVRRVLELYPDRQNLQELCPWALSEKLRPQAPEMKPHEVARLYHSARDLFLREMYPALSKEFGRRIEGPLDVVRASRWLPTALLKRIYWVAKFRGLRMEREQAVFFAQAFLVSAFRRDGIHEPDLRHAILHLRFADPGISASLDWNQARIEASRLRMEL